MLLIAKVFCKQLGFVKLSPRIWIAVFFDFICLLLVYFVSAAGCLCFDLLQLFCQMAKMAQKSGSRPKSYAAHRQECVLGVFKF